MQLQEGDDKTYERDGGIVVVVWRERDGGTVVVLVMWQTK
jgi:hypothetical protein